MLAAVDNLFNANCDEMPNSQPSQMEKSGIYEEHYQNICFSLQISPGVGNVDHKEHLPRVSMDRDVICMPVSKELTKQPFKLIGVNTGIYSDSEHLSDTIPMGYSRAAACTVFPSSANFLDQETQIDVASVLESTEPRLTIVAGDLPPLGPLPVPGRKLGNNDLKSFSLTASLFTHYSCTVTAGMLQSHQLPKGRTRCLKLLGDIPAATVPSGRPSADLKKGDLPAMLAPTLPTGSFFATCQCPDDVAEKMRGSAEEHHSLGLISLLSSSICMLKQQYLVCFEGWGASSSCPGTVSRGFSFSFFFGNASTLLFCVARCLWRFEKHAVTIP